MFIILLIILPGAATTWSGEEKGTLHIIIENLRNSDGFVRISLFNSKEGFPTNKEKALFTRKTGIEKGRAEAYFENLPYGYYAAGVLHDENANGKLDFKWGILPSEGLGASNNPEPGLMPPSFNESRIRVQSSQRDVRIRIYY